MRVLVTGATGFVGGHVVDALRARGDTVRAIVRPRSRDALPAAAGVEPFIGDLTDDATLTGAAHGCDAVVHCAALVAWRASEADAVAANVAATEHLAGLAIEAGLKRFVHIGSVAEETEPDTWYGRTKALARVRLLERLPTATALRPPLVYGPGDRGGTTRIAALVKASPVVPVPARTRPTRPVYVGDVVAAVLGALDAPLPRVQGQTYDLAGPDRVELRGYVEAIARVLGLHRRFIPVPTQLFVRALAAVGVGPAQHRMLGYLNPAPAGRWGGTAGPDLDTTPATRDLGVVCRALELGLRATLIR